MPELNLNPSDELEPFLVPAVAALRVPPALDSGFDDRVMAAVRSVERPRAGKARGRWVRASRWATESHVIELSPLRGLAAAAGLAALLASAVWLGRQTMSYPRLPGGNPAIATVESGLRRVEFVLMAPEASEVVLVGDFNGWRPGATPLRPSERQGIWSVTVPLSPGRHEYAFLVDGKHWLPDPRAPRAPTNDFGSPNSVLTVTERS
jgi:hypothetical protein